MKKKKGNFFEQYVDKIVIGISAMLSLGLLWVFVLSNPYGQEISGRKYGPSQLDDVINREAETLQTRLDAPADAMSSYGSRLVEFEEKMRGGIAPVGSFVPPAPGFGENRVEEKRRYRLPDIPMVADVDIEAIRTVVYVPMEKIDQEVSYGNVQVKRDDIDLVTVQATFDVDALNKSFYNSFANRRLKSSWRNPRFVKPVFASVELQRSKEQADGGWGQWETVGPTKVNNLGKLLDVPEKVSGLQAGLGLDFRLNRFAKYDVQSQLLQPEPYVFASPRQEWLTPTLHKEYVKILERKEQEERREEQEREKELKRSRVTTSRGRSGGAQQSARSRGGGTARGRTPSGTSRTGRRGDPQIGRLGGEYDDPAARRSMLAKARQKTLLDVKGELGDVWILEEEDISQRKDPITFWAHDDSLTDAGKYQYRIRIGVFNPIAGRDWVDGDQQHLDQQVILWSAYSEPTATVLIEKMIHFFPLATNVGEDNTDSVNVQVSKYFLGRWRSESFSLKSGEPIGRLVESESARSASRPVMGRDGYDDYRAMEGMEGGSGYALMEPTEIDYETGSVLVDVVASGDWQGPGGLKRRQFREILYTSDGVNLEHLAIGSRYWPGQMATAYDKVKQDEAKKPFRYVTFNANTSIRKQSIQQRNSRRDAMMDGYDRMDMDGYRGSRDAGGPAMRRRPPR